MENSHFEPLAKFAQAGARIRKIREKSGLSQKDFGKKLGVKNSTISEIERGNTRPSETILIANEHIFGYPREWVLHGEGPDTMPPKEILLEVPRDIVQSINGDGNLQAARDIQGRGEARVRGRRLVGGTREEEISWSSAAPAGGPLADLVELLKDYGTPKMIDDLREKLLRIKKMVEGE